MSRFSSPSYWCYRCTRFTGVSSHRRDSSLFCPDFNGGFIEEIHSPTLSPESTLSDSRRRRSPAPELYDQQSPEHRPRRNTSGQSPFNPVIVLRGHTVDSGDDGGFEMFYDDVSVSGLSPLPAGMELFLDSGLNRLLNQLTQIEANGLGRIDRNPPALKSAIEALPTIEIQEHHLLTDSHCAVCKDPFELETEAKEMPCEHLYHSDCILPWLTLHNSCPVCRRELPSENQDSGDGNVEAVGLMIWRLPGGGVAVGRRRQEAEMGGGGGVSGSPVRGLWGYGGGGGRLRRVLGGVFSCFGGGGRRRGLSSSSSSSSDDGGSGGSRFIPAIFSGFSRRRRAWVFDGNDRGQMW